VDFCDVEVFGLWDSTSADQGIGDDSVKRYLVKLRNERGMICISAHPEAEKLEEQHHSAQHAHTPFLLVLHCIGCSLNYGD
jgi:hypothetical protein